MATGFQPHIMMSFEWRKLSRLVPVKVSPKVINEEKAAASREVLPYQLV